MIKFVSLYTALILVASVLAFSLVKKTDQAAGCDGYSNCAYPITYPPRSFVQNEIEKDTARRAQKALVDMTVPPVKTQARMPQNVYLSSSN